MFVKWRPLKDALIVMPKYFASLAPTPQVHGQGQRGGRDGKPLGDGVRGRGQGPNRRNTTDGPADLLSIKGHGFRTYKRTCLECPLNDGWLQRAGGHHARVRDHRQVVGRRTRVGGALQGEEAVRADRVLGSAFLMLRI